MTEQATSTSREEMPTGDDPAGPGGTTPETPFTRLDDYLALRRLGGLALSPDGIRLVTTVAERTPDGKRFSTSLWEVDPGGQRPPRRLTRSAPGEGEGRSASAEPSKTPAGVTAATPVTTTLRSGRGGARWLRASPCT